MTAAEQKQVPVTLQDIAAQCGVDRSTVSLALRRQGRISPATVERITRAAEELGYDPAHHETARRMVMQRLGKETLSQVIGLLYPADYLETNFYTTILRGMTGVLNAEQYGLLIFAPETGEHPSPPIMLSAFRRGDVDGMIVLGKPAWFTHFVLEMRQNPRFHNRPVMLLFAEEPGCVTLTADSEGGAYDATMHLLQLGHRHLMKLIYPQIPGQNPEPAPQVGGSQRALREYGLDPAAHLHLVEVDFAWVSATGLAQFQHQLHLPQHAHAPEHLVFTCLRQHPQTTAILAINDASAIRTWALLQQGGLRVPDDISLVGFDDTDPVLDEHGQNMLTTVRLPLREFGETAAKQMIDFVNGAPAPAQPVRMDTQLIVRKSTAACPSHYAP